MTATCDTQIENVTRKLLHEERKGADASLQEQMLVDTRMPFTADRTITCRRARA